MMLENVIEKVNVVRKFVLDFMIKFDKVMFKILGKKKLDVIFNIYMVVNKWLRKVKNKKGVGGGVLGVFGKLKLKFELLKIDGK